MRITLPIRPFGALLVLFALFAGAESRLSVKEPSGVPSAALDHSLQQKMGKILQSYQKDLNASEVMALVMDPETGGLVAALSSSDDEPDSRSRFVSYRFEPGGLMAPFVIAGALEHNESTRLRPDTRIQTDERRYRIGGPYLLNNTPQYTRQSVTDILVHASHVGLAKIAVALSGEAMYRTLKAFGFGGPTGKKDPHESVGVYKNEKAFQRKIVRVTIALGHGILVTPLQLLRAYGVFVNGGKRVGVPIKKSKRVSDTQVISKSVAEEIMNMLRENVRRGTGRVAQVVGLDVGGKTSMARRVEKGRYVNRFNAGFYGFAQKNDHTYVIGILILDPQRTQGRDLASAAPFLFAQVAKILDRHGLFDDKKESE